jgi:LPS export ABC transporter protein LptC
MRASVVVLVLTAIVAFAAVRAFEGKAERKPQAEAGTFMEDVVVTNKREGVSQWAVSTRKAWLSEDGKSARMDSVTVVIPDREMTIVADSGIYNMETMDLTLSGNINAATDDYTIKADSAELSGDRDEISSDGMVVVEGKGFRVEGTGLRAGSENGARLLGDVRAEFH